MYDFEKAVIIFVAITSLLTSFMFYFGAVAAIAFGNGFLTFEFNRLGEAKAEMYIYIFCICAQLLATWYILFNEVQLKSWKKA